MCQLEARFEGLYLVLILVKVIVLPMELPSSEKPTSAVRSNEENAFARLRRFVVVEERPGGRETYRAM